MIYYAKITKQEDGSYLVVFPDVPGCMTEGSSLTAAKANAREALTGWLAARCDRDLNIPTPKDRAAKNFHAIAVDIQVEFAVSLRLLRKSRKLSQTQVARKMGITQQAYAKLETPLKTNPSLSTIQRLAQALDANFEVRLIA